MSVAVRAAVLPLATSVWIVVAHLFESDASPLAAPRALVAAMVVAAVLFTISTLATRDPWFASIVATALLFTPGAPLALAASLACIGLFFVVARILERRRARPIPWQKVSRRATALVAVLLTTGTALFVIDGGGPSFVRDFRQGASSAQIDPASDALLSAATPPNIYIVLLDGYPRADTVRDQLHFDDTRFHSDLLGMGFAIAAGNRSNYPLTVLSLSSMFQMRLLNDVPDLGKALKGESYSSTFRRAINDSPALDALRAHGYRIYATSPDYEGVALRQADVYLDPGTLNSFERAVLSRNGLATVVQVLWPAFVGDQSRAKVEGAYRALEALSKLPTGPRFAFVHIPIPHQPNLYGPAGEARDVPIQAYGTMDNMDVGSDTYLRDYQGQLRYVADRTSKAIRTVVASDPGAVIVVMSDHGSRLGEIGLIEDDEAERVRNFMAIRSPGHADLADQVQTNVNLFPTLFDAYLGTKVARQPNLSYRPDGVHEVH